MCGIAVEISKLRHMELFKICLQQNGSGAFQFIKAESEADFNVWIFINLHLKRIRVICNTRCFK